MARKNSAERLDAAAKIAAANAALAEAKAEERAALEAEAIANSNPLYEAIEALAKCCGVPEDAHHPFRVAMARLRPDTDDE